MAMQRLKTFVWATGQEDNIGDSLLRRAYVESLLPGTQKVVWVRDATPAFITGLGGDTETTFVASFARWAWEIFRSSLSARTIIALNAGEMAVSWRGAAKLVTLTTLGGLARVRGGGTVWIGAGIPRTGRTAVLALYRWAARSSRFVRWRDEDTARQLGVGVAGPDWAFALGTAAEDWPTASERSRLGVVLRGDRPEPDADWWDWIDALAARLGLDVVLVAQVRRDRALVRHVSTERGYARLDWETGASHSTQERLVRQEYGRCRAVIGDRLHGLIVAATEGAVPLGWVASSSGKIGRHLEVVGLGYAGEGEGATRTRPDLDEADVSAFERRLFAATRMAREFIDRESSQIDAIFDESRGAVPTPLEAARR